MKVLMLVILVFTTVALHVKEATTSNRRSEVVLNRRANDAIMNNGLGNELAKNAAINALGSTLAQKAAPSTQFNKVNNGVLNDVLNDPAINVAGFLPISPLRRRDETNTVLDRRANDAIMNNGLANEIGKNLALNALGSTFGQKAAPSSQSNKVNDGVLNDVLNDPAINVAGFLPISPLRRRKEPNTKLNRRANDAIMNNGLGNELAKNAAINALGSTLAQKAAPSTQFNKVNNGVLNDVLNDPAINVAGFLPISPLRRRKEPNTVLDRRANDAIMNSGLANEIGKNLALNALGSTFGQKAAPSSQSNKVNNGALNDVLNDPAINFAGFLPISPLRRRASEAIANEGVANELLKNSVVNVLGVTLGQGSDTGSDINDVSESNGTSDKVNNGVLNDVVSDLNVNVAGFSA